MPETKRDPSIGLDWLAWWALKGDEPIECVADYLAYAEKELGVFVARLSTHVRSQRSNDFARADETFLSGLHLVLLGLISAASDDGQVDFKMQFVPRPGRPGGGWERVLQEHAAARVAEKLRAEGWKMSSAVTEAVKETGVPRSAIYDRLAKRRLMRGMAGALSENPPRVSGPKTG